MWNIRWGFYEGGNSLKLHIKIYLGYNFNIFYKQDLKLGLEMGFCLNKKPPKEVGG